MSASQGFKSRLVEAKSDGQALAVTPVGQSAIFALVDGRVAIVGPDDAISYVSIWEDETLLVAAGDGSRLIVGGSNGQLAAVLPTGEIQAIGGTYGGWIDALAARPDGSVAWSVGKKVYARNPQGEIKTFSALSSVRGLCFMPKGYRLAAACYNGVSLWFPNLAAEPEFLEWRGSHLAVTASPDGRFVVSAMQENALHGWRLTDRKNMRMTGYPTKTRSFSWSSDGLWLATSGAEACIVWPFAGKDGPMGRGPNEYGVRPARVTQVAFHPKKPVVAVGYDDGWILLCRTDTQEEAIIRSPSAEEPPDPVMALAWGAGGDVFWFGTKSGILGAASPTNLG